MFPKTGRKLHSANGEIDLAIKISEALVAELGSSHRTVKTAMAWTGASERTVKHWLAATHVPQGSHLVSLARHSDQVLGAILLAANREDLRIAMELSAVRSKLLELVSLLEGR
jgi:membrane protein required for beta-lactamase induction